MKRGNVILHVPNPQNEKLLPLVNISSRILNNCACNRRVHFSEEKDKQKSQAKLNSPWTVTVLFLLPAPSAHQRELGPHFVHLYTFQFLCKSPSDAAFHLFVFSLEACLDMFPLFPLADVAVMTLSRFPLAVTVQESLLLRKARA